MPSSPVGSIDGSAVPLQPGQPVSGSLPTSSDHDYYAIGVQTGLSYALTVTPVTPAFLHLSVVDASGATTAGSVQNFTTWFAYSFIGYLPPNTSVTSIVAPAPPGTGSVTYTFTALSTGTIYTEIDGQSFGPVQAGSSAPATYTVELGAPDDDGSTPATAGQLAVGGSVSGRFDVPNDVDEFAIVLEAGKTYEFDDLGYTQFEMTLFGSADRGTYLAHWSPYSPALTYTPASSGTYYLDLSSREGIEPYTVGAKLLTEPSTTTLQADPAISPTTTQPGTASYTPEATITPVTVGVYRFSNKTDGTHFFTSSASERDTILATRPDLVNEGVGLSAVDPAAVDANTVAVYRFFDTKFGTHFYTASASEKDTVIATRSDLTFEGVGFYEHAAPAAGDVAVYRFFDSIHGTHFYTADASERANILSVRPDLKDEGIGFYAPAS